ncbi:MAG TPA: phage portal protein, partial [Thiobacillaceae bacterium]
MPDYESGAGAPAALTKEEVRTLYNELRGAASGRNSEYAQARDRYQGKHWGDADNPTPDGRRYTLTLNYIRPTVNKTVQLLLGQMPGIQVMPPGVDEGARRLAESEEALLYKTWDVNEAAKVFRRVAHNRALLRRGLIYYWWDAAGKRVGFRSVAPDNFYPVYDGEEIVECIIVSRRLTRSLQRMYPKLAGQIVADNQGDDVFDESRWQRVVNGQADILDQGGASGDTIRSLAGQTTVLDWFDKYGNHVRLMGEAMHKQNLGYGMNRVPVIEFPNSLPGDEREPHAEIDDVMTLNLYLDQLISQQADIIRRYANPTIIDKQSGQSAQQIRQTVQGDGGVLPIKRDGDILLLNWDGTPPDIANQYARVMTAIYDLSGKPATAYGQLMSNQSGVATNMALSPATLTTEEAMSLFGLGLIQLNEAILVLNERFMKGQQIEIRIAAQGGRSTSVQYYDVTITGDEIGGWYKNRIKWPSALRTDDPIYVQNELAKMKGDGSNPPA